MMNTVTAMAFNIVTSTTANTQTTSYVEA